MVFNRGWSEKWYNKLPESVSKGTEKCLLALGFAIDGYTVLDGIQNNDYSQVGKGLGSCVGGLIAMGACTYIKLEGLPLVIASFFISAGLSTLFSGSGEHAGEQYEISNLEVTLSEAGIEVIWE